MHCSELFPFILCSMKSVVILMGFPLLMTFSSFSFSELNILVLFYVLTGTCLGSFSLSFSHLFISYLVLCMFPVSARACHS